MNYDPKERIVYITFSSSLTNINLELAKETRELAFEMTGNDKFGFWVDFRDVLYVDSKARDYWAEDQSKGRIIAVAGCYKNELQKNVINIFLAFRKIDYKVRFFTNCSEAKNWLIQILKSEIQK